MTTETTVSESATETMVSVAHITTFMIALKLANKGRQDAVAQEWYQYALAVTLYLLDPANHTNPDRAPYLKQKTKT